MPDVENNLSMIQSALAQVGSIYGDNKPMSEELFGTPLPHFCQRFFFSSNVLPAGKIYLLAGEQHVGKTAVMLEFLRIICTYAASIYGSSAAFGIHSEEKWPDTLPPSIMGGLSASLRVDGADTAQEWMSMLTTTMLGSKKDGITGITKKPLNTFPLVMFVDSMHGAQGEEKDRKIRKEGAPTRDFSEIARITTEFFPSFSGWLSKTAATMFFILHLKSNQDGLYTPGGKSKDFFASYTIHLTNPKKHVAPTKEGTIGFNMSLRKDSYGPGGTWMPMEMKWAFNDDGKQYTWFDWEACTMQMFEIWMGSTDKALGKKHPVRDLIGDLQGRQGGIHGKLYKLPAITGDEFLTAKEFNTALESNSTFKLALDCAFHITQRPATHEFFQRKELEAQEADTARKKGRRKKSDAESEGPVDQTSNFDVGAGGLNE